jgi:hypothetical protein
VCVFGSYPPLSRQVSLSQCKNSQALKLTYKILLNTVVLRRKKTFIRRREESKFRFVIDLRRNGDLKEANLGL